MSPSWYAGRERNDSSRDNRYSASLMSGRASSTPDWWHRHILLALDLMAQFLNRKVVSAGVAYLRRQSAQVAVSESS